MDLENVIFDLDGTLVDSLPGIEYSVDRSLAALGYPARTGSLRPLIGMSMEGISAETSLMVGETGEEAARKTGMPVAILKDGYGDFRRMPSCPSCRFVRKLSDLYCVFGGAE